MFDKDSSEHSNCGSSIVDRETEPWYCDECGEYRDIDGEEGFPCDHPRDCPSDAFGDQNCGYIVCGECHGILSDRHLAPGMGIDASGELE